MKERLGEQSAREDHFCHFTQFNRRTVNGPFFYQAQASIKRCQAAAESGLWSSSQMTD